jgi:hypothetical protein
MKYGGSSLTKATNRTAARRAGDGAVSRASSISAATPDALSLAPRVVPAES